MLEPGSISTTAAIEGLTKAKKFWDRLKPTVKAKVWLKLEKQFTDFSGYLGSTYNRASNVQLICSRNINSNIDDIYVSSFFTKKDSQDKPITDNDLISDIRDGKRVVVRGNGGSGKTLFLKRLWLDVFHEPKGKIPVLIELRKFNQFSDIDIMSLIRHTLSTNKSISEDLFKEMAADGYFFLVFDGFDEIAVERRDRVEAQILEFERLYRKCNVIVSSRPNENFVGWQVFDTYDVVPFKRQQTLDLISKAPLDPGLIKRFSKLITDKFFNKYEEFLSSPLLALMMLVTFKRKGDISDISDNIVEFYDNAFHALYSEHDAIKEQFRRPHCLKINDFRLVFSTFCMFSYYKEKFDFKEAEIREYVQKSIDHVNLTKDPKDKIKCSVDDFLHEVLDAVNLMRKDGMLFCFIHRSFQEYFTAYWLIYIDSTRTEALLKELCLRPQDTVLNLGYQMNKIKIDQSYVLPFYDRFIAEQKIFKSKPADKPRWLYVEGYDFIAKWQLVSQKKPTDDKPIPNLVPGWENGQVGIYYTNLDSIVFKRTLRKKFFPTIYGALKAARPSWLIKDYYSEKEFKTCFLKASIQAGEIRVEIFDTHNNRIEDVTQKYLTDNPKYRAKIESAFDQIETLLHGFNKTVNAHIASIRDGHVASEKSLDDIFF